MNKTRNTFLLILTAFIWGVAFVAQSVGNAYVGPWTFTASRSVIGALFLIPCIAFLDKLKAKETFYINGKSSHYLENVGNIEAKILWVTTPPMF